jgi:hypothetical protein
MRRKCNFFVVDDCAPDISHLEQLPLTIDPLI